MAERRVAGCGPRCKLYQSGKERRSVVIGMKIEEKQGWEWYV